MTTLYATLVTPRPRARLRARLRPRLRARLTVQRKEATNVGARDELAELDFVLSNTEMYVYTNRINNNNAKLLNSFSWKTLT